MRRRNNRQPLTDFDRGAGGLTAAIGRHPREFVGILMATAAMIAIFINAVFLQHGPHPAPIFVTQPMAMQESPVVALPRPRAAEPIVVAAPPAHSRVQIISDIQRELSRRGYYDGAADGIWGAKTDAAARDFVQAAGLKINPEASEGLLRAIVASPSKAQSGRAAAPEPVRGDPIAQLIAPSQRVLSIQRALTDFGYGQIKPTGVTDPDTQGAIEKFERDRRLPVTGQISERFVRELAGMTGRPLE